jgi:hypothetical protein
MGRILPLDGRTREGDKAMFTVRYKTGYNGYWAFEIIDRRGHIALTSIYDHDYPDSVYAAERVAHEVCDGMNRTEAVNV